MSEHIVPVKTYVSVWIALMCLTGLTTGVAYIDMREWNTVVALLIAVIKMSLVVLFFMHIKYASGLTRVLIIGGFFWLGLMLTFSLADELTRHWEYNPAAWGPGVIFLHLPHLLRFL